jgi:hypothetical protein
MSTADARQLARSWWARSRFWLALAGLLLVGALVVTALTQPSGQPLDPQSASRSGSLALSRLLAMRGVHIDRVTSLSEATAPTVLVAFPNAYSADQLTGLARSGHRLILIDPDQGILDAVSAGRLEIGNDPGDDPGDDEPGCAQPGAVATGRLDLPDDIETFDSIGWAGELCYGGAVAVSPELVVLGSGNLLTNADLANTGVAALAINLLSADGSVPGLDWLLVGADAGGSGTPSVWRILPDWAPRALFVLGLLGVIIALWRGRRLGPVVLEPLPVVVRSAELVEGHGRLYERGHAHAQASAALRAGTRSRLASIVGVAARAPVATLADALAPLVHRPSAQIQGLLADGSPPVNDEDLMNLARALDDLERAAKDARTAVNREQT